MTQPKPAVQSPDVNDGGNNDLVRLSSSDVNKLHANSDVDSSVTGQHHTLGILHNQGSPGDHTHNGKSSKRIGKSLNPGFPSVASATYSQSQIQTIIDALRLLGFGT